MSTESDVMPEAIDAQRIAPAITSPSRPVYWSVRRELWENRSLYVAPLIVAGLALFGFLIGAIHLPGKMRSALALAPMQQHAFIEQPYNMAAALIMGASFLVSVFYCLDALYGERRDRSILFWKSLPVSDLTVVLAKASIPLVILPLITFAVTVATQFIILVVNATVLLTSGVGTAALWEHMSFFPMSLMLLYHLVAIHGLWYAPFYGWMLLASAWARRAPFLWAVLPPFGIGVVEKIAFGTTYFAAMLQNRFMGNTGPMSFSESVGTSMEPLKQFTPGQLLSSPELWIGFAITAIFLAAAVRIRRYRDPL